VKKGFSPVAVGFVKVEICVGDSFAHVDKGLRILVSVKGKSGFFEVKSTVNGFIHVLILENRKKFYV